MKNLLFRMRSFSFGLNTIAARLTLVYVLLLLPVVALDVRSIRTRIESDRHAAELRARDVAWLIRDHIETHLTESVSILNTAAHIPIFYELPSPTQNEFLSLLHADFPYFTNLSIVNKYGYITASSTPFEEPVYVGDSENIRSAFELQEVGFARPMAGVLTGETTIVISYPLINQDGVQGAINAGVSLGWINDYLNSIPLEHEHLVVVFSGDREIIALRTPDPEVMPQYVSSSFSTQIREIVSQSEGMGTVTAPALDDIRLIGASVDIQQIPGGLTVAAGLPEDHVRAPIHRYLRARVLTLLTSLIVAIGLAWFTTRRLLLRQFDDLRVHSTRIAAGDLHSRIPMDGLPAEFRTLAESLNEMSARLETHEEELNTLVQLRTAELEAERDRAEQAAAAKNVFVASVSHEVRTPLNGLLGMLQLMDTDSVTEEQQHEYLALARESGEHLLTLINDLLDLSRIEHGSLTLEYRTFRPVLLCRRLVDEFQLDARRRGLELNFSAICSTAHEQSGAQALGDPVRVRQIISNLISNALRYTEEGSVQVAAGCERRGERLHLEFSVTDTGSGIAPEQQETIFDRFTQLTSKPGHGKAGAGLGLAISRELARAMGGDITVDSTPGVGSSFRFTVILEHAQDPSSLTEASTGTVRELPTQARRRLSILVVEDNRISRLAMRHMLDRLGHSCEAVSCGEAALERLCSDHFDCIMLDQQLHDMQGTELLAQIRASNSACLDPSIPAIAVSAYAMDTDKQEFLNAGMSEYLTKPVQLDELARTLNRVAEGDFALDADGDIRT